VGFIARVDVQMGLATVAETVTVSGAAPVVDVTSTTNQTLLTREVLELTPTSRKSLMSILALAPGVRTRIDVGGDQMLEDARRHPGWRKGVRIGNVKDGKVSAFIPGHETDSPAAPRAKESR
jgi:hypothetical protein